MSKKSIIIIAVTFFVLLAVSIVSVLAYYTYFSNNEKAALEKAFKQVVEAETMTGEYSMKTTVSSPSMFGESFSLNIGLDGNFAIDKKDKALEGDITFDIPFLAAYYDGSYSYELKMIDNVIYTKDPEVKDWTAVDLEESGEYIPDFFDPELYNPESDAYKELMKKSGYTEEQLKKMNEMMVDSKMDPNDLSYWKYQKEDKYEGKTVYVYKFNMDTIEMKKYLDDTIDLAMEELKNNPEYDGISFDVKLGEFYYLLMVYKDSSEIANMKLVADITYMYEIDKDVYGYDDTMPTEFDIRLKDLEFEIVFDSFNKDIDIKKPTNVVESDSPFIEDDYLNF